MLSGRVVHLFAVSHTSIHIACQTHRRLPVQLDLFARKEPIDLLQGKIACFRVEEVNKWQEAEVKDCQNLVNLGLKRDEGIHTGKINVGSIANVANADWSDFNDQECKYPFYSVSLWKSFKVFSSSHTICCSCQSCRASSNS